MRQHKTKNEKRSKVREFTILFNLPGRRVATKAPTKNSHEREVGEKKEAVG
jgi:hypothetical protein